MRTSRTTRARHVQLKALCCVDTASGDPRRDSGGTVSSEAHDSPLVARGAAASSSSGDVLPRFRASTPPPFEGASRGCARGDAEDRRDAGETSGSGDDLRRDSESSRGAASEGELERDGDWRLERLWREKRGLLRKNPDTAGDACAVGAVDDAVVRSGGGGDGETTRAARGSDARRRSFDGGLGLGSTRGERATHHRAESEPVPGYVPPRLDAAAELEWDGALGASEADDLVGSLKRGRGGSTGPRRDPTGAPAAFEEHLKKTVLLGRRARSASGVSVTSTLCDEDSCPTCFEAYDAENPKMALVCGHHFHLACVYEWYERSDKCPVCEAKMEFDPSTGWSLEG